MSKESFEPQKLFIFETHQAVREAFEHYFASRPEFSVVGRSGDAPAAIRLIGKTAPHLVLLDPTQSGSQARRLMRHWLRRNPRPRFVALVENLGQACMRAAREAGADEVVAKSASLEEICVTLCRRPGAVGTKPGVRDCRVPGTGSAGEAPALTVREKLVLQLVAAGGSNKGIAGHLKLSLFTVENHRAAIRRKLGLRTTQQLVIYAMQNGLLHLPALVPSRSASA